MALTDEEKVELAKKLATQTEALMERYNQRFKVMNDKMTYHVAGLGNVPVSNDMHLTTLVFSLALMLPDDKFLEFVAAKTICEQMQKMIVDMMEKEDKP